jgi:hypothetical protein
MQSEVLRNESPADSTFPYEYLLQWEWPEHIEMLLRRLVWGQLTALAGGNSLAENEDHMAAKLCWSIAVNPSSNPAVLDVLATIQSSAFAERVAENPNTSSETLARLAKHPSHQVRCAVTEHTNTPEHILRNLTKDEHPDVRYCLAENHNLAEDVLEILSEDENGYIAARATRTLARLRPVQPLPMKFRKPSADAVQLRKRAQG